MPGLHWGYAESFPMTDLACLIRNNCIIRENILNKRSQAVTMVTVRFKVLNLVLHGIAVNYFSLIILLQLQGLLILAL